MGFLSRLLGVPTNGHRQPVALAHTPDATTPTPEIGSVLNQFFGESKVSGEIKKLLGVFNPRWVDTNTRLLMRTDPDVAFGLAILRGPIINMNWTVESQDPFIKAFVDTQLKAVYRKLATGLSQAMTFGYQLSEKVWESKPYTVTSENDVTGEQEFKSLPNAWVYHDFKAIDPRTYTLLIDKEKDEFGGVEQNANRRTIGTGPRVGPEKVALWSFRKEEVWGQLNGFAMTDQSYTPWYDKSALTLFCNRYFERKADPAYKALADAQIKDGNGRLVDGFQFIVNAILGLKNGGVLVLPNRRDPQGNLQFDVSTMQDDKRGDMFQQRLDSLSQQILRALWITDKAATSDGTGSLAMAEVHADTMSGMMQSILQEWLDEVVNPQIVAPLVLYNFGQQALDQSGTRVTTGGLTKSMRDMLQTLLTQLLQAEQLTDAGSRVTLLERLDAAGIAKSLGLPMRSPEELEELAQQKAARAPFPNGQSGQPPNPNRDEDAEPDDKVIADELVRQGVMEGDELE